MKEEALDLVEDLNNETEERGGLNYYCPFEFRSYGWNNSAIYFMGVLIWTEENDEREYISGTDENEPLYNYVIREAERILKDIKFE